MGKLTAIAVKAALQKPGTYVMRDLFSSQDDGWLQDPALVELLVSEKLREVAQEVAAEGWKWVEAAVDLPYGCERGLRRIIGTSVPLTDEEQVRRDALVEEYDRIGAEYPDGADLPDAVDVRLTEIDHELSALNCRPTVYDPDEMARAGAFISLAHDGRARIDRGYVRREDEPGAAHEGPAQAEACSAETEAVAAPNGGPIPDVEAGDEENDVSRPLQDELDVGMLGINSGIVSDPAAPFGGVKHSGLGREGGTEGIEEYLSVRYAAIGRDGGQARAILPGQGVVA